MSSFAAFISSRVATISSVLDFPMVRVVRVRREGDASESGEGEISDRVWSGRGTEGVAADADDECFAAYNARGERVVVIQVMNMK